MPFQYSNKGIKMNDFDVIPRGQYVLIITEAEERTSKNGDPMVAVTLEVDDDAQQLGKKIWHYVTFISQERKGAGMAIHFLKCIDEPWEGDIIVTPEKWIGKRIYAWVGIEADSLGNDRNRIMKIKKVDSIDGPTKKLEIDDEVVPF